jgi:uncharacterized protein YndB with AHSA1/START domain
VAGEYNAEYTATLPESVETVFAALTQPAEITRWWGDDSVYWMTDVRHGLEPGVNSAAPA